MKITIPSRPVSISLYCLALTISSLPAAVPRMVTTPDSGAAPQINTYGANGGSTGSFFNDTSGFTGGVRVAMGNVDGVSDIVTGSGPGAGPRVRVFTGPNHTPLYSFDAFAPTFTLGIFVASGDVNGDGVADIIVGAGDGNGSSPQVKVFSGADGVSVLANFFAFDTNFAGGVRVAAGDIDGDGRADLIVGTGAGAAQVKVFSGKDLSLIRNFLPFVGYTGGVYVAAGDVNGDGFDDVIVGAGTGAGRVSVFSGKDESLLHNFFAFMGSTAGVRVGSSDLNGDRRADIIVSNGPGDPSRVRVLDGETLNAHLDFAPYGQATNGVFVGAIPRFPSQLLNISTRLNVLTGDNALIGGFILTGTERKSILIRGIGPSSGAPGALANPTLELFRGNTSLGTNDDWKSTQKTAIEQTGIPPGNDLESAILQTLPAGTYTAVLRGSGNGTGIGLVEVYDLDQAAELRLGNISSRGFVKNGDDVMIGGMILAGGSGASRILVRAIGPSSGVPGALADPTLGLYNSNGILLRDNDNWRDSQEADIQGTGIAPPNNSESAILTVLPPGSYTGIVSGKDGKTGIALVEVYNL